MKDTALGVAGAVFLIIGIVHFLRLILGFEIIVAGYVLPIWFSVPGSIIPLALSFWMFKALKAPSGT